MRRVLRCCRTLFCRRFPRATSCKTSARSVQRLNKADNLSYQWNCVLFADGRMHTNFFQEGSNLQYCTTCWLCVNITDVIGVSRCQLSKTCNAFFTMTQAQNRISWGGECPVTQNYISVIYDNLNMSLPDHALGRGASDGWIQLSYENVCV